MTLEFQGLGLALGLLDCQCVDPPPPPTPHIHTHRGVRTCLKLLYVNNRFEKTELVYADGPQDKKTHTVTLTRASQTKHSDCWAQMLVMKGVRQQQ